MKPSVAAISAAAVDFLCWSYPTFCVASMRAEPVGCISYNMYFVDALRSVFYLGISEGSSPQDFNSPQKKIINHYTK